jgi:hypothetical protein
MLEYEGFDAELEAVVRYVKEVTVTKGRSMHGIGTLGRVFLVFGTALMALVLLMLLPDAARSSETQQSLPEGWQDVASETFEGGIGSGWTVTDSSTLDGGEYYWGTEAYPGPGASAWAVGAGAQGDGLTAGTHDYPANVDSWLIYGPVTLTQVFHADLTFDWWLDSAPGDWFGWCVVDSPSDPAASCSEARIAGAIQTWISGTISLDEHALTEAPVYLAFHFTSDDDGQAGQGAFVDNVILRGDYGQHLFLPVVRHDPTPTPSGYEYDFSGPTTWKLAQKTDGRPGTWWSIENSSGYLKVLNDERWDHIIVSPKVTGPGAPFEIETNIYFAQRSWSAGYGIVFGAADPAFASSYYRILAAYQQAGSMKIQIKRMHGTDSTERIVLDWSGIPVSKLNGQAWNTWRIVRSGNKIHVYTNGHLIASVSDSAITGEGYFGLFLSNWEFKPAEIWVDYFDITHQ